VRWTSRCIGRRPDLDDRQHGSTRFEPVAVRAAAPAPSDQPRFGAHQDRRARAVGHCGCAESGSPRCEYSVAWAGRLMPRRASNTASAGARSLLIAKRERLMERWAIPRKPDALLQDLRPGAPVLVSAAADDRAAGSAFRFWRRRRLLCSMSVTSSASGQAANELAAHRSLQASTFPPAWIGTASPLQSAVALETVSGKLGFGRPAQICDMRIRWMTALIGRSVSHREVTPRTVAATRYIARADAAPLTTPACVSGTSVS
jgi:hypothetical protein